MAHSETHGGEHHEEFHVVPARYLIGTGLALLILTVITVAAAKIDFAEYDLVELNIWIALAIATVKASLVCLFFMHLWWDRAFNAFVLVSSIAFVALFIGFAMTDTFEYRPDIEQYVADELAGGDAPAVQTKLSEIGEP